MAAHNCRSALCVFSVKDACFRSICASMPVHRCIAGVFKRFKDFATYGRCSKTEIASMFVESKRQREWERRLAGDECSSSSEFRWTPPAGMLMYLSSAAGINRCCPLAICYNPLYPFCFSRGNPLGLIVALNDSGMAEGSFFWDDGEGIGKLKGHPWTFTHAHTHTYAGNVRLSFVGPKNHFGPNCNISKAIEWIAMKFSMSPW